MKSGYEKFFTEARKAAPKKGLPRDMAVERLRKNKRERRLRRRRPLPLYPVLCTAAVFALCVVGYYQSDRLDEWLAKIEVGVFGRATAAESEPTAKNDKNEKNEKSAAVQGAKTEKPAGSNVAEKKVEPVNVKQWTPEELSFFSKLSARKKELDLREAELDKLEEELQKRKSELDEKLKTLEAMRTEISKTLKSRVATDQEKVDKLVQVYSSMKAAQAAKVIETLNEDLAVEVLDKMKKKSAAEILDMMTAKKARRLSELLTGYQRSPAATEDDDGAADDTEPAAASSARAAGPAATSKK